jgi:hypothetical protein
MLGSSRLRALLTDKVLGASGLTATVIEELGRFTSEGWNRRTTLPCWRCNVSRPWIRPEP